MPVFWSLGLIFHPFVAREGFELPIQRSHQRSFQPQTRMTNRLQRTKAPIPNSTFTTSFAYSVEPACTLACRSLRNMGVVKPPSPPTRPRGVSTIKSPARSIPARASKYRICFATELCSIRTYSSMPAPLITILVPFFSLWCCRNALHLPLPSDPPVLLLHQVANIFFFVHLLFPFAPKSLHFLSRLSMSTLNVIAGSVAYSISDPTSHVDR
jgi:hypothetical protein